MIHDYSQTPVFFDFETQSAADLPEIGGRNYAECPSTRIMSLACLIDGHLHFWIPAGVAPAFRSTPYLPPQYNGLYHDVAIHQTPTLPPAIADAVVSGRVFAAHNCSNFDAFIWKNCITARGIGPLPTTWADTMYLSRLAGLPRGGLDDVAKRLLGESKDAAHKIIRPLFFAKWDNGEVIYPTILPGMVDPLIRYCSVDVLILARLWEIFHDLPVEQDAIIAHDAINERGIACDLSLASRLSVVSVEASRRAGEEIERITGGELYGDRPDRKGNLRSLDAVHAWLKRHGVEIVMEVATEEGTTRKRTLRKDVVEQYLANPFLMLGEDTEISLSFLKSFNETTLPLITKVLKCRSVATRITSAKTDRMVKRVGAEGRLYDLHTYHKAHTGRASSQGVQIHNLPRGKKGIDLQLLLTAHENGSWPNQASDAYDFISCTLPPGCTVDDALSALIRPCLTAKDGCVLGIADYAAVERRGVAWIADDYKHIDIFLDGRDIYCEFMTTLLGREVTKKDKDERQLGKIAELGLGYGMGEEKFALTCSLSGIDLKKLNVSPAKIVETWRARNPLIAGSYSGQWQGKTMRRGGIWEQLNTAALRAVIEGGVHTAGKCSFVYSENILRVSLPSGRELRYFNCRVEDRVPSFALTLGIAMKARPTIVYDGDRGETTMYGGKWTENIVQAICRDLLYTAIVRAYHAGLPFVANVHDETVGEYKLDTAESSLRQQATLMSTPPAWAAGFPIGVEAYLSKRYLKDAPKGSFSLDALNGVITNAHYKK